MTRTATTSRLALALLAVAACSSRRSRPHGGDAGAAASGDAAVGLAVADAGAAVPAAYRAALRRGRDLAHAGDAAGAVAAFQQALAARPDDARALSELSWVAFIAGDLEVARDAAERSIAAADPATEPRLAAASLYNLGRVAERLGDPAAALDAYQRSLALRPSRTVERRVRALSTPGWSEQPVALAGPFADLAGFCADLGLDEDDVDADAWCVPEARPVPHPALPAPFLEVAVVRHAEAPDDVSQDLAVRTAAGWWVLADFGAEGPWTATAVDAVDVAFDRLVVRSHTDERRDQRWHSRHVTVCGVDHDRPGCLGPLLVRDAEEPAAGGAERVALDYQVTVSARDLVIVKARRVDPDHDIAGAHPLAFP